MIVEAIALRKTVDDFVFKSVGTDDPNGYSFSICFPLSVLLSLLNIEHEITSGKANRKGVVVHHFWLTLEKNATIIDPTIRQFKASEKAVYIGKIEGNETTNSYTDRTRIENVSTSPVYYSWSAPLFRKEPRISRSKEFESRTGLLNIRAALTLIDYIRKHDLEDGFLTSAYAKAYLEPIVSYVRSVPGIAAALDTSTHRTPGEALDSLIELYSRFR